MRGSAVQSLPLQLVFPVFIIEPIAVVFIQLLIKLYFSTKKIYDDILSKNEKPGNKVIKLFFLATNTCCSISNSVCL
jgi:hypothetical protein